MLGEKEFHRLKEELQPLLPAMDKAATAIKNEDISNYPVFIVYKAEEEVGLGLPLFGEREAIGKWGVNASTLEELASKNVVAMDKVQRFCDIYKTHQNAVCFLVWKEADVRLVFLPL